MSKIIFKYILPLEGDINFVHYFKLDIAEGHEILTLDVQFYRPCLWTRGDDTQRKVTRHFVVIGTGAQLHSMHELKYIGTFQLNGGVYVGHLFEVIHETVEAIVRNQDVFQLTEGSNN